MPSRFHVPGPLHRGQTLLLPEGVARHVQVLRLQPGVAITLFNGEGGQWSATVCKMGRKTVHVLVGEHCRGDAAELPQPITLALGMPTNERMDAVVEKATELGVARIVPLLCERSVLRLSGERAQRKQAHWQAVAVAACEQSGRTRVPEVAAIVPLQVWLKQLSPHLPARRLLLSLNEGVAVNSLDIASEPVMTLSGPEGGLTAQEAAAALTHGFAPVSLGARVLRADTAPLAVLAWWALRS
jgi:16S rRNA (uracil1498-N3)-methyltransferase